MLIPEDTEYSKLRERVGHVLQVLRQESAPFGQVPRLIAVTKTVGPDRILPLRDMGVTDIGENRVQVLRDKLPALQGNFDLHLIGRLQRNKVKYIINDVCMIHSADNLPLLQEIDRRAQENNRIMPVLLQINIAGEAQKGGIPPEEAETLLRQAAGLPGVKVRGLMTMMPALASRDEMLSWFTGMRVLRDRLRELAVPNTEVTELSMGMSRDYALAAACGATMVRVGSALFADEGQAAKSGQRTADGGQ